MLRLNAMSPDFEARFVQMLGMKRETSVDVDDDVSAIIARVRAGGDAALIDLTERFDHVRLTPDTLRVSSGEIQAAMDTVDKEMLDALKFARDRIMAYHARQMPLDDRFVDAEGVTLGHRWTAVQSVGLYVPGGTASYPSSVLMSALPARVAGVRRLVMTVPATHGVVNDLTLVAAALADVHEIYRIGGAQAIAALAYGTATIAPVDKIAGPGNAYVAAAKRHVFGHVGIDMVAGPSEVLVLADESANPDWVAIDLLAQAEHDVAARSILITDSEDLALAVETSVDQHLKSLSRADIISRSLADFGVIIVVDRLDEAIPLVDRIAPEHLQIDTADPESLAAGVHNAGAIFLGSCTTEAIGDYVAGPSHVLPTACGARYASGLSVLDFLKRSSIIGCDLDSLRRIGPVAIEMARSEGLDAHARSVSIRLTADH